MMHNFESSFIRINFKLILLAFFCCIQVAIAQKVVLTESEQIFIAQHPLIKIAGTSDSAPLLIRHSDNSLDGIDVEIAKLIYQHTGLKIAFEDNPWHQSVNKAMAREVDGFSGSVYNLERENLFNVSRWYLRSTPKVYVKKGNPHNIHRLSDLNHKTTVIRQGTQNIINFAKKMQNSIIYKETSLEMIDALIDGQADYFVFFDNIEYLADKQGIDYIDVAFTLGKPKDVVFSLRNDWPELTSIVNKGLEAIPEYQKIEIRKRWFGTAKKTKSKKTIEWTKDEQAYLDLKDKILMCVDPDWLPLERIDSEGKHIGIAADILKILQTKSGLKLEFVPSQSWPESIKLAKQRKCDLFSLAMVTPERLEYMDFTSPYVSFPFVIATQDSEIFIDNIESLFNKKISLVKGYAYVELLRKKYPKIQIVEVENLMQGLKWVRESKVYGHIDALATVAYAIQKNGMTDVKIAGKFDEKWTLSIATRNDEPILKRIMQKALDTISTETTQIIYNKWLAIRFEERVNYTLIYQIVTAFILITLLGLWRYRVIRQLNKTISKKNIQLQQAYEQYSWLAENMDDVVWVMDESGKFIYISPSVEKLRAYTSDEIMMQSFEEVICEGSRQLVIDEMALGIKAAEQGKVPPLRNLRVEQPCKDGSTVWTEVNSRLIVDPLSGNRQFIGLTRDISKTIEYEQKLQVAYADINEAKVKAEQANQTKSEFLSNMSHEIRTPLNGVIGMTELMLESPLKEEQYKRALIVKNSAESLLSIINDILDFSKIESGKLEVENIEFNLSSLLEDFAASIEYQAEQKELIFRCPVKPLNQHWFMGDSVRIVQVLFNLVGNAIKFTEKGEVSVCCEVLETKDNIATLCFQVKDTGIGLSLEAKEKLFERFTQEDSSITRKYGGTGLGLAISKQLVKLMQGEIGIESELGNGSSFWFKLKLPVGTGKIATQSTQQSEHLSHVRATILLVEDNLTNQEVAKGLLEKYGVILDIANNGQEALEKFETQDFDLIFMDCHMPILDGYETTVKIRESEKATGQSIPIIAMTANAMKQDVEKSLASGMNDHISKPVRSTRLKNVLITWLGERCSFGNVEQQIKYEKQPIETKNIDINTFDQIAFVKDMSDDIALARIVAQTFLNDMPKQLALLESYFESDDRESIKAQAHKIKGAAKNIYSNSVSKIVWDIEKEAIEADSQYLELKLSEFISEYETLKKSLLAFL